ncbi:MAG: hypothetical protein KBT03_05860 [Bacteroidales bacterium]|nr:hypothetical protein [Candidatus Scybalousia scybalohippi]
MADKLEEQDKTETDGDSTENEDTPEIPPSSRIIVEDGTCVPNANSYITYEEALEHQTARNRTDWLDLDEAARVASIIRGTEYIDSVFNWRGRRKYESQELAFPRVMLFDLDGFPVNGIPKRVKLAVLEATYYMSLNEDVELTTESGPVKRERADVVEMEYFANSSDSEGGEDTTSKYKPLNRILRGLYFPKRWKGGIVTKALWLGV